MSFACRCALLAVAPLALLSAACGGEPRVATPTQGTSSAPRDALAPSVATAGSSARAALPTQSSGVASNGASDRVVGALTPGTRVVSVASVSAGSDVTCAALADKTLWCWGDGQFDVVQGGGREHPRPAQVPTPAPVTEVAVGAAHACVRHEDGTMSCWGSNYSGELGTGTPTNPPGSGLLVPTRVPGVSDVTAVSANAHSAALLSSGKVMFWGDYDSGSGDPRPAGSAKPALVVGIRDAVEVVSGSGSCARLSSGAVRCWYAVSPGLIPRGKDRVDPMNAPVRGAVALYPQSAGACAITKTPRLVCWAFLTQLITDPFPGMAALVAKGDVAQLAFSSDAACARMRSGAVACEEQDGSGTGTGVVRPVPSLTGVTSIVAGGSHFCALEHDKLLCWGANAFGQLGDGTTKTRLTPTPVVW